MSNSLFTQMAWLPPAPSGFAAQCKAEVPAQESLGRHFQALAAHALDENNLIKLAKTIRKARDAGKSLAPLTPFRLGIISNATSHFLLPALEATAARHGIALECIEADFDQVMQEALSPESTINRAQLDAVLIAVDYRGLPLKTSAGDGDTAKASVVAALTHLNMVRNGLKRNGKTICIIQNIARPVEALFGGLDAVLPGTLRSLIDDINRGIAESILDTEDLLFDVAHLAETVGLADWHDATMWNMAKVPFASVFLPLYVDHVCRLVAAMRGKSRRCLILDLDNTVWGGVIGDDGLEGIVIGQGDATGEAHLAVQRTALNLRDRGVVLAVSSKNTDEVARGPFRNHPEMLLREEHIAVFQANWNDKATNITAIAKELALGLDAMVFLDDNPVERNLIRQMLPQVAVPELPADPALYARTLLAAGYFESITFSVEDKQRAGFYQDNARRVALQSQAGDMDAYLQSLDMVMTVQRFDETGRSRIAQLINKSNQYNLTTRRYTEVEVADIENDADCFALQIRLADVFGDNGMISVVICRHELDSWHIDTWLMSCRVLGRKVEHAVLDVLCQQAQRRGITQLIGIYIPTDRNALVEDHYAGLGFMPVDAPDDGSTVWQLPIDNVANSALPMAVRCIALDPLAEGVAHAS
ncbi:MAG: haloacid dehalogenase [Rhodocyclales bacterium]|nr:haloacid dehalogenase [Rhodocyclales bacterium]